MPTLWALTQADVLIGTVSSFSWAAAVVSTRPVALLQEFERSAAFAFKSTGEDYAWCLNDHGCCRVEGSCNWVARAAMAAAAERLAHMAACGQLDSRSLSDELTAFPAPVVPVHPNVTGLGWEAVLGLPGGALAAMMEQWDAPAGVPRQRT